MIQCAWCLELFEPTTVSQIYHSAECRQQATRQRIAEQYKIRRRVKKKIKYCSNGCGTKLSIYNESSYCTICMANKKEFKNLIREIKDIANGKIY